MRRGFVTRVRAAWLAVLLGLMGCLPRSDAPKPLRVGPGQPPLLILTNVASWSRTGIGPASVEVELESPPIVTGEAWDELVVSWVVEPADGAGLRVEARARVDGRWSRSYRLADWSLAGAEPVFRTSPENERDADGAVKTDTLAMHRPADAVRLRVRLSGALARAPERLRWIALSWCDTRRTLASRDPEKRGWGKTLDVPERSQIAYAGGEGWCSPTSISMLLGWWSRQLGRPDLDRDVPEVARGVHDPGWPGTGNWPFNTAYAGSFPGMRACAARLRDLRDVEDLVAAGIPVALSVNAPALRGKPVTPNGGHLVLCVGFTSEGDVVANDPWARFEEGQRVRRVYARSNVERAWSHAHRLAYLVAPENEARRFPAVWR